MAIDVGTVLGLTATAAFLVFIHRWFAALRLSTRRLVAWGPTRGHRATDPRTVQGMIGALPFSFGRVVQREFGSASAKLVLEVEGLPTMPLVEVVSKQRFGYVVVHRIWNRAPDLEVGSVAVYGEDPGHVATWLDSGLREVVEDFPAGFYLVFHRGRLTVGKVSYFQHWSREDFDAAMRLATAVTALARS